MKKEDLNRQYFVQLIGRQAHGRDMGHDLIS
jgi:hypothetical protein